MRVTIDEEGVVIDFNDVAQATEHLSKYLMEDD